MISSAELHNKSKKHLIILFIDFIVIFLRTLFGQNKIDKWLGLTFSLPSIIQLAQKDVNIFIDPFETIEEKLSEEALKKMLESLEKEAHLTPTGQFLCIQKIRNALRIQLKIKQFITQNPKIVDEPIIKPIFILGFPRSGTTILHRTLTQTKQFQYLTLFQALNPLSCLKNIEPYHQKSYSSVLCNLILRIFGFRKKYIEQDLYDTHTFLLKFLAKRLQYIHDCHMDQAEEESILLDMCFTSLLTEAMFRVPSYSQFLQEAEPIHMYIFLKKVLQIIQYKNQDIRPWILKSPNHIEWIPQLLKIFPDARFIHPIRSLETCLLSTISASCHARRMCSDSVNIQEVSEHWKKKYEYLIRKIKFIKNRYKLNILEITYYSFVKNTSLTINTIFHFLDLPLIKTDNILITSNSSNHHYTMEDFGLSKEKLNSLPIIMSLKS